MLPVSSISSTMVKMAQKQYALSGVMFGIILTMFIAEIGSLIFTWETFPTIFLLDVVIFLGVTLARALI